MEALRCPANLNLIPPFSPLSMANPVQPCGLCVLSNGDMNLTHQFLFSFTCRHRSRRCWCSTNALAVSEGADGVGSAQHGLKEARFYLTTAQRVLNISKNPYPLSRHIVYVDQQDGVDDHTNGVF